MNRQFFWNYCKFSFHIFTLVPLGGQFETNPSPSGQQVKSRVNNIYFFYYIFKRGFVGQLVI
jgi:hypothetical protein